MYIQGYSLALHQVTGVNRTLYSHQAVLLDEWERHDAFMLITKTGSGKTAAAARPLLRRVKEGRQPEGAVFVYPTNALIVDQERSIRGLAEQEYVVVAELTPESVRAKYGSEQMLLVRIDADRLEQFAKALEFHRPGGEVDKGRALVEILRLDKPKIVLTNPDVLYLIYALAYRHSAESVAILQGYQTVVFDEFHLYGGVELAHALFLIHLARALHAFGRVVLLSATPDVQTRAWIDKVLSPFIVDATTATTRPQVGERTVAHAVALMVESRGKEVVETGAQHILALRDRLRALRKDNADPDYVPAVVILNSVVNAIELEQRLVVSGFLWDEIASVRGLVGSAARDVRGKTLAIGTSAIEVGIDFRCDYLIFEAGDAASFIQRFGRVGRHQPGRAFLLESTRIVDAFSGVTEISRSDLEARISTLYDVADARPWFVDTEMGILTVASQANHLRRRVADAHFANPEYVAQIDAWLDQVLVAYAATLGAERMLVQVQSKYKRLARGSRHERWIQDYEAIDTFRTSLPQARVYDRDEAERRGSTFATYSVDIYTLVRKACRFAYNDKTGNMVVSGGWESPHRVYFSQPFTDDDCGSLKTTADYPDMVLYREGHMTSVSYSLVKPVPHVFIVLPKSAQPNDWRLAVFPCGNYIVAFDGDALVLRETWCRQKSATASSSG